MYGVEADILRPNFKTVRQVSLFEATAIQLVGRKYSFGRDCSLEGCGGQNPCVYRNTELIKIVRVQVVIWVSTTCK